MQMVVEGHEILKNSVELANDLRKSINEIPGLFCFGKEVLTKAGAYDFDPTKITVNCRNLGISGYTLEQILANEYKIQVELSDLYNILAVVTIGDTIESVSMLNFALQEISARFGLVDFIEDIMEMPRIPPRLMSPRDAFYGSTKQVVIEESVGEICAEIIMAYPPGIPIITQGEIITEEIVQYIKILKMSGLDVQGTEDPYVNYVKVIDVQVVSQIVPIA